MKQYKHNFYNANFTPFTCAKKVLEFSQVGDNFEGVMVCAQYRVEIWFSHLVFSHIYQMTLYIQG
jgi:hypothetical protein